MSDLLFLLGVAIRLTLYQRIEVVNLFQPYSLTSGKPASGAGGDNSGVSRFFLVARSHIEYQLLCITLSV